MKKENTVINFMRRIAAEFKEGFRIILEHDVERRKELLAGGFLSAKYLY